jgi:hypothetical protein
MDAVLEKIPEHSRLIKLIIQDVTLVFLIVDCWSSLCMTQMYNNKSHTKI